MSIQLILAAGKRCCSRSLNCPQCLWSRPRPRISNQCMAVSSSECVSDTSVESPFFVVGYAVTPRVTSFDNLRWLTLKSQIISNTHGGLTRKQSTFYEMNLTRPRTVQFTQEFSRTSYEENTNRNTLLAFYEIDENNHRQELPINNEGYVYREGAIDYNDDEGVLFNEDYPVTRLDVGKYLFVITNDIRYIETNYSIGLNVSVLDWRFVNENIEEQIDFGLITAQQVTSNVNFGNL